MIPKLYYYAGYDRLHLESTIRNFYWDTKENILLTLRTNSEFKEGTTQEEIDAYLEDVFNCYTKEKD